MVQGQPTGWPFFVPFYIFTCAAQASGRDSGAINHSIIQSFVPFYQSIIRCSQSFNRSMEPFHHF